MGIVYTYHTPQLEAATRGRTTKLARAALKYRTLSPDLKL